MQKLKAINAGGINATGIQLFILALIIPALASLAMLFSLPCWWLQVPILVYLVLECCSSIRVNVTDGKAEIVRSPAIIIPSVVALFLLLRILVVMTGGKQDFVFFTYKNSYLDIFNILFFVILAKLKTSNVEGEESRTGSGTFLSTAYPYVLALCLSSYFFMKGHTLLPPMFLMFVFAFFTLLSGLSTVPAVRTVLSTRKHLSILLFILLIALSARCFVSQKTIVHTNSHGYNQIEAIIHHTDADPHPLYGRGYFAFFHPFTTFVDPSENSVFQVNIAIGTASVFLLFLIMYLLTGSANTAVLASVIFAVLPAHVKFSSSESFFILVVFLQLLTLLSFLSYIKFDRPQFLVSGLIFLFYLVQTRPAQIVFGIVVLLFCMLVSGRLSDLIRKKELWISLLIFSILVFEVIIKTYSNYTVNKGSVRPGVYGAEIVPLVLKTLGVAGDGKPLNVYLDPDYTPVVFIVFFFMGLLYLLMNDRRKFVFFSLSTFIITFIYSPVSTHPINDIRFQTGHQHFYVMIAACTGCFIDKWFLKGRSEKWVLALFVAAVIANSFFYIDFVREKCSPQYEYVFLSKNIRNLPKGCTIVYQDIELEGSTVQTDLPTYLSVKYSLDHKWTRYSEFPGKEPDDPGECNIFYRGVSCYTFSGENDIEPVAVERYQCRDMMESFETEPIITEVIPSRRDYTHVYRVEEMEIGFYRIVNGRTRRLRKPPAR